jgi:hypothetical protein
MKRFPSLAIVAFAFSVLASACGSDSPAAPTTPTNPTFTATLSPSNEVPAIVGAEAAGSGTATVTIVTNKDAAGNITSATATFVVNLQGFPAGTPINIAHIHQAAAGVNGSVVVNSGLTAGQNVLTTGSGSFTAAGLVVDPALAQNILNNPAGFYFNVHSTLNPGGVARGQLVRVQ